MNIRDQKNLDTVTKDEMLLIKTKTVAIIGAGGLGGYVIETCARFGIGHLKIVDYDVFDESNLNRQLTSCESNLGLSKVIEAKRRINSINSEVQVTAIEDRFTYAKGLEWFKDVDIVIDCLDNVESRFELEDCCNELNKPLIHGAVGGWNGQVITVLPGDNILRNIYGTDSTNYPVVGAASFIPATIASYQVGECIKVLLNKGNILHRKMMYFDLLHNENFVIDLGQN